MVHEDNNAAGSQPSLVQSQIISVQFRSFQHPSTFTLTFNISILLLFAHIAFKHITSKLFYQVYVIHNTEPISTTHWSISLSIKSEVLQTGEAGNPHSLIQHSDCTSSVHCIDEFFHHVEPCDIQLDHWQSGRQTQEWASLCNETLWEVLQIQSNFSVVEQCFAKEENDLLPSAWLSLFRLYTCK